MSEPNTYYAIGIGLYFLLMTWAFARTFRENRSAERTIAYEALGVQRFAAPIIAILVAEAMLGPADTLTLSQNGFLYGAVWAVFPLGAALAQAVTGVVFSRRIFDNYTNHLTVGDIFAERCGSSARLVAGAIVLCQSIAFAGVLVLAGGQVLESLLGLNRTLGMLATALVVGLYTSIGGISVVINTNKVQAAFAWSVALLALVSSIYILQTSMDWTASEIIVKPAFYKDHSLKQAIGLFIAYFMGELLLPAYAVRILVSRSALAARRGFLLAALLLVVWYIVVTTAGSIGAILPAGGRQSTDNLILLDIVSSVFGQRTVGAYLAAALIGAGLLALIHSTLNVFLNSGAVAFAHDVLASRVEDGKAQGFVQRVAVVVIALLGLLVGLQGDSLIGALLIGYTIWVPTLLAPFCWILLTKQRRLSAAAFWSSLLAGAVGWYLFEYQVQTFVPGILAGFVTSWGALFIVERALSRSMDGLPVSR